MKLSGLFAKYLYQHKILRLPGVGIFTLDPSITVPDVSDKSFPEFLQNIHYVQQPVNAADEDFINFIRTETGKIKPLAESDLDSYLSDGKILLNIGKPFHLEGIGYLQKIREGTYEFKSGEPMSQRLESFAHEHEEAGTKPKQFFLDSNFQTNGLRKLLVALGAIAAIVLVIWGGYSLYNRNANPSTAVDSISISPADTSNANTILDSVQNIISSSMNEIASGQGTYKFVIEKTANKGRALRRFNQLRENLTDIKMETKDSTLFKLYFVLPAQPSDTTRIKDSLKIWYGRKEVFVEK